MRRLRREGLGPGEVYGVAVDVSSSESVAASAGAAPRPQRCTLLRLRPLMAACAAAVVAARFPGMPISLLACNAGVGGSGSVIHSDQEQVHGAPEPQLHSRLARACGTLGLAGHSPGFT